MESILEIETDLLPPERIPTAPFEFPKAWVRSTISKEDYFFQVLALLIPLIVHHHSISKMVGQNIHNMN